MSHSQPNIPPLIKEYSEKMKIPLDTISTLQFMEVLDYKPLFPIIIVLGEASAGTSVTSTLLGLNLPSDLAIPIVLKFKYDSDIASRKILFEYLFEGSFYKKEVSETRLANKIIKLMKRVPEDKRWRTKVTLTITQPQVSDLMVVLLPEFHTHQNEYEEKKEIELIQRYIESHNGCCDHLFLNVLSCPSNFNSCLSRKVLKGLDYSGTHCITVFTKVDLSDEYLISVLTSKNVVTPSPFGYFVVDNTTDDDEKKTDECVLLSKVEKEYVGFDVISKNIVAAMLAILFKPGYLILERIESDLKESVVMLNRRQKTFGSVKDAIPDVMLIVSMAYSSVMKLFIHGDYIEYRKDKYMHAASNVALRFEKLKTDLHDLKHDNRKPFLQYEVEILKRTSQYNLLYLLSSSVLKSLLHRQFSEASSIIDEFVSSIMEYIERVVVKVLLNHEIYSWQLHPFMIQIGRVLVKGMRKSYLKKLTEMLDMEKEFVYTSSDEFARKMKEMESVKLELDGGEDFIDIEGFGNNINVEHLKGYPKSQVKVAFEQKKENVVYWEIVVNRFVDYCYLNLQTLIKKMMTDGIEEVTREHLMTRMKDETKLPDHVVSVVAFNKLDMEHRIKYLKKIKKDIERWQVSSDVFRDRYMFDRGL
ncbi:dynamin-related protein 4C-like [Bidens hawaiensis]|uniref:dynamin-related protein 4C-like n=1 Tax=Bidens hawaiensis TaxID=980011 RepID=UPI00404A250B